MTTSILAGAMIGTGAGLLFLLEGRIAGVSGMLTHGLDRATSDRDWRLAFLVAIVAGGGIVEALAPGALAHAVTASTGRIATAGLLVGLGARLANGCTSGHGLCGVARGSGRSVVAVTIFMIFGAGTVLALRVIDGGLR